MKRAKPEGRAQSWHVAWLRAFVRLRFEIVRNKGLLFCRSFIRDVSHDRHLDRHHRDDGDFTAV